MVSDEVMAVGVRWFLFCLVAVRALSQNDGNKLSPQELRRLIDSHEQAKKELRQAEAKDVSGYISNGFSNDYNSVAIVKIGRVTPRGEHFYDLDVSVERVLRGKLPRRVSAEVYWSVTPQPIKSEIPCGQRLQPKSGRRMLAAVDELPYTGPPTARRCVWGFLDLDNPLEAAYLPQAEAAADMETSASVAGWLPTKRDSPATAVPSAI